MKQTTLSSATRKVNVRYRLDFLGWAMECPRCGALSIRDTWRTAYWTALSHWVAHARHDDTTGRQVPA